jgi:hypothetical protein
MKTNLALLAAGCSLLAISACQKSSADSSNAKLMFVNGSVGATSTSLAVNGAALANASNIAYLGNSGYQAAAAGNVTLTASLTGVGSIGSLTATLTANDNYSVVECGTILADSIITVNDALPAASGNYAYARLINASSDTSATAITAAVGNTVVGSNIAYATASGWTQVSPGSYSLTAFNVNAPGNVATLAATQLNSGKFYTLLYSGNANQTVGFKLTVINNN